MRATRASMMSLPRPMASHGSRTCSRRPTRTAATRPMWRPSSAQNEWMTNHLPKRGTVIEVNEWGQPKLPPKAERVWGKPGKSDCTGWYLDRDVQIQWVAFRVPQPKKAKGKAAEADETAADEIGTTAKPRPDVTRKGMEMIGDLRTDALHEAL